MPELAIMKPRSRAEIVDEYGELYRQLRMFAPLSDRAEALRKVIQGWFADYPAELEGKEEGTNYVLRVGRRALVRSIPPANLRKLMKLIKQGPFLTHCSFPVRALKDLELAPEVIAQLVVEEQTGVRKVEAIPISPVAVK